MSDSMKINPFLTIAAYPAFAAENLRPDDNNKSICEKYLALTLAEAFYILGTTIGVIETIFWGAIFLLAKAIHICSPQSLLCDWLFGRAGFALLMTVVCSTSVVMNFFTSREDLNKIRHSVSATLCLKSIADAMHIPGL